jgi:hypothetical protein
LVFSPMFEQIKKVRDVKIITRLIDPFFLYLCGNFWKLKAYVAGWNDLQSAIGPQPRSLRPNLPARPSTKKFLDFATNARPPPRTLRTTTGTSVGRRSATLASRKVWHRTIASLRSWPPIRSKTFSKFSSLRTLLTCGDALTAITSSKRHASWSGWTCGAQNVRKTTISSNAWKK